MRYFLKSLTLSSIILLISLNLSGQENYAANVQKDISNSQKMLITFDLPSPNPGALFNVKLTLSENGKNIKYVNAFGDFGNLISAGRSKAIVWYFKDDFNGNIGDVKVNIEASLIPMPVAGFKYKIKGDKLPYQVEFINSSENCDTFSWNFDDPGSGPSNLSSIENPVHTYLRARTYNVTLKVLSGESGMQDSVMVQIPLNRGELPMADFSYSLTSTKAPTTGWFKSTSKNADEFYWNFDDPDSGKDNYSDKKSPVHIFRKDGTYQVVLTVTNTTSMERHSHTEKIIVKGN